MVLELTPDELLTTTRSVRKRLDLDRPVERSVIEECIDLALQAPTGSNSQGWQWVVVEDPSPQASRSPTTTAANFDAVHRHARVPTVPPTTIRGRSARKRSGRRPTYLRQHFHEVPAMVIPLPDGPGAATTRRRSPSAELLGLAAAGGVELHAGVAVAAAWARAWTTLHLPNEREVADLARHPVRPLHPGRASFPVAYTKGTDFKPATRVPARELIHWDTVVSAELSTRRSPLGAMLARRWGRSTMNSVRCAGNTYSPMRTGVPAGVGGDPLAHAAPATRPGPRAARRRRRRRRRPRWSAPRRRARTGSSS